MRVVDNIEQNGDHADIILPQSQIDYIKELAIHGARIILVLTGDHPIAASCVQPNTFPLGALKNRVVVAGFP